MAVQAQMYSGFGFGGSQDYNLMDNAYGLNSGCFAPQQKLQHEQQLMQRVPPFMPKYNVDDQESVAFAQAVYTHVENQRTEIDLFINSQNERLSMALQEQRKQQLTLFMKKYESKIHNLIRQKDEEIEKAAKRTGELQDYLKRMEIERQTWQRAARDNEAAAAALSSAIERLRATSSGEAGCAESHCCPGDNDETVRNESRERETRKMICKCCHVRDSCVIMLPCRHLCSCSNCEAFLDSCPVCKTVKTAIIEALI